MKDTQPIPPDEFVPDSLRRIPRHRKPATGSGSGGGWFSALLLVLGVVVCGYFFFIYDTSVATSSSERVENVGRLNFRLCGLVIGGVMFLGGLLVSLLGKSK